MGALDNALRTLIDLGLVEVFLPFILLYTIIFAVLQKSGILGADRTESRKYNVMVALALSLGPVIAHATRSVEPSMDVIIIMNKALPQVSLVVVALLMLLLILGIFGHDIDIAGTPLAGWSVLFAIGSIAFIFIGSATDFRGLPQWSQFLNDTETQSLIILILVFAVVVWFITSDPNKEKKDGSFVDDLGKLFVPRKDR